MTDPYITAGHIRRALRTILDHYDEAADPPKITDDSERRGGRPDRPPTDVHAIDCRVEAHRDLAYYAQYILDEINDGTITTTVRGSNLTELARFIDTWALALAEQRPDDADQCRTDTTKHARRLKAVAHGTRTRAIEVGPCPEIVMTETVPGVETLTRCDGTIVASLTERDPDSQDDGLLPRHLTCTIDSTHTWQPWQWADIGKRIERMAG